jgi:hypothetical protein
MEIIELLKDYFGFRIILYENSKKTEEQAKKKM